MSSLMIMAGGTGGHIYPALAVAHSLQAEGINVFWLGTRAGLESRIVPENHIEMEWISISGIKGRGLLAKLTAPFKIFYAMGQTAVIIFRRRPSAVLGMGGFVSGPGGLMAWLLRVPLLIHESNAILGLTNKWLAKISSEVLVGFPEVLRNNRHVHYVGNPIRKEIADLTAVDVQPVENTRRNLHLLVVGGSRGAQVLNEVVPDALAELDQENRPQVLHQTGANKLSSTREIYTEQNVSANCQEFIDDMAAAYTWADLVICRAGAMTVAEVAAAGVAAIFVPYPYAIYDHQTLNAQFLSSKSAALLMPQDEFSAASLSEVILELNSDKNQLYRFSQAAREQAKTDATDSVVKICKEVMHA